MPTRIKLVALKTLRCRDRHSLTTEVPVTMETCSYMDRMTKATGEQIKLQTETSDFASTKHAGAYIVNHIVGNEMKTQNLWVKLLAQLCREAWMPIQI